MNIEKEIADLKERVTSNRKWADDADHDFKSLYELADKVEHLENWKGVHNDNFATRGSFLRELKERVESIAMSQDEIDLNLAEVTKIAERVEALETQIKEIGDWMKAWEITAEETAERLKDLENDSWHPKGQVVWENPDLQPVKGDTDPKEEQPEGYKHIKCEKGYGVECPKCKTVFNYRRQKVGGGVQTCPSCGHGAKPSQWRVVEYRESPPADTPAKQPITLRSSEADTKPDTPESNRYVTCLGCHERWENWVEYDGSPCECGSDSEVVEGRDKPKESTPESKDQRIAELEESDESMKEILRRNIATTEKAEAERDRALRRSEKYCLDLGEKETTVTELRAEVELTKGISDGFSVALMEAEAKLKAVEDAIIAFRREAVDAAAIDGETWLPSKTSGAMARMLAIIGDANNDG